MICPRYTVVGVMEEFETSLAMLQVMHDKSCHVQLTHLVQVMLSEFQEFLPRWFQGAAKTEVTKDHR